MHHLTREQVYQLLTVARQHSQSDWLMLLMCYWHALRITECLNLRPSDLQDGYLHIRRGKGSLTSRQPLISHPDSILDEKGALSTYKPAGVRLFNISRIQAWRRVKRYGRLANIPAYLAHPHVLRHSLAVHSLQKGVALPAIQRYLGHRSLASTGMYLLVNDQQASSEVQAALL